MQTNFKPLPLKREISHTALNSSSFSTSTSNANCDFTPFLKHEEDIKLTLHRCISQLQEEIQALKITIKTMRNTPSPPDFKESSIDLLPMPIEIPEHIKAIADEAQFDDKLKKMLEARIHTTNLSSTKEYLMWRRQVDNFYRRFPDFKPMIYSGHQLLNTINGNVRADAISWLDQQPPTISCKWESLRRYLDDKFFVTHTPAEIAKKIMNFKFLGTPMQIQANFYNEIDLYDHNITKYAIETLKLKLPPCLAPSMQNANYTTVQEFFEDLCKICLMPITEEMHQMRHKYQQDKNSFRSNNINNKYKCNYNDHRHYQTDEYRHTSESNQQHNNNFRPNNNNNFRPNRYNNDNFSSNAYNNTNNNSKCNDNYQNSSNNKSSPHYNQNQTPQKEVKHQSNSKKGTARFHYVAVNDPPTPNNNDFEGELITLNHIALTPQHNNSSKSTKCNLPEFYVPPLQHFRIKLGTNQHNWIETIALLDSGSQINAIHSSIANQLHISTSALLAQQRLLFANNTTETVNSYIPQLRFKLYDAQNDTINYENDTTAVITSSLPNNVKVLLGLNFIMSHLVKVNFWTGEITTKKGHKLKQLTPPYSPQLCNPKRANRQEKTNFNMNLQSNTDLTTNDDYNEFESQINELSPIIQDSYKHKFYSNGNDVNVGIEMKRTALFTYNIQQHQLLKAHIDKLLNKRFQVDKHRNHTSFSINKFIIIIIFYITLDIYIYILANIMLIFYSQIITQQLYKFYNTLFIILVLFYL